MAAPSWRAGQPVKFRRSQHGMGASGDVARHLLNVELHRLGTPGATMNSKPERYPVEA